MGSCSVFVSSCDRYEDAWYPFFTLLRKYWNDCPYEIFLSTETKKCNQYNVTTINDRNNPSNLWGRRIKQALKKIDSDYIIFLLEDYFFTGKVKQKEIERCIRYLDEDNNISVFCFEKKCNWEYKDDNRFPSFLLRDDKPSFYLNCQAAIWRRKDLIKYINVNESPWQFEEFGSGRAKLYGKKFYTFAYNNDTVFQYEFDLKKGLGIHGGWLKGNIELFKKENLEVDFSKLGFYEPDLEEQEKSIMPPEINLGWKAIYFLYGGGRTRISIGQFCKLFYKKPTKALYILKDRIQFLGRRYAPEMMAVSEQ